MRLIDADKVRRLGKRGGIVQWRDTENAPTVDAVEVVRCKDCVYYKAGGCRAKETIVIETEFCSWGERRENAEIY